VLTQSKIQNLQSKILRPRWRKVLRDMWGSKLRTVLVVLSIAVGVFAVGTIATSRIILTRDLNQAYLSINPSNAIVYGGPFPDDLVATVRSMPDVGAAEGRRSIRAQVQIGPDRWRDIDLFAIPDYNNIAVDVVRPQQGAWPPPEQEILIERVSLPLVNAQVGDTVLIEMPDGKQRTVRVAGTTYDINRPPAVFSGTANGYITFATLEWLGEDRRYDELRFTVAQNTLDAEHIKQVATDVRHKMERGGLAVGGVYLPPPGKHPADEQVQPMLLILGVLGGLALVLSGFLVINTTGAILAQQIRQIGVMKAVGARAGQVMRMYLLMVALFGLLALAVAVPLGALGARGLTTYAANLINFNISSYRIPPNVLALEIVVALVVPLVAALWPIIGGTRITVRQAISSYGIGNAPVKRGVIDRVLERVRGLSRPLLLSLRNTFRRKGRLVLTLTTLTLAGAIVIAVFSVRASLLQTLDDALQYWRYDVDVNLNRAYRIEQIERLALQVPGVVAAESWNFLNVRRVRPNGTESDRILMIALPAQTRMLQPTVLAGRWLLPDDENAVVINTDLRADEPDLNVGDEIVLTINGNERTWQIVGLVQGVLAGPFGYSNAPYWQRTVGDVGRAGSVQVVTAQHDAAAQQAVATALRDHFEQHGINVSSTGTTSDTRESSEAQFNVLIVFLLIMAALLAVVGGLGLMGTMSINVLERTREIGVLRAVGASTRAILQIVIGEGVLIGLLSWVLGTVLALPLGKLMSDAVGNSFLDAPLSYVFSWGGALVWLGVVALLAIIASVLPARNAARLSVREVLAYE
jgi:putative ABC transport system permease protein